METTGTLECRDRAEVESVAARLAACLRPGDVVLLTGPIGAGKTCFVRALAAALGSEDPVTSPTYALMHIHETAAGRLLHLDAYRLSGAQEYRDLGIEDLAPGAITVVEWGERIAAVHREHLRIEFRLVGRSACARGLVLEGRGERWRAGMCGPLRADAADDDRDLP